MSIRRALALAERLDPAALDWLQDGFRRWLALGGTLPLHRCLGLPGSPQGLRKALRDYWLNQAFLAATEPTPGERLTAIAAEVRAVHRYEAWMRRGVPQHATPMQACILRAYEAGATMPTTEKWLRHVLGFDAGTNCPEFVPAEPDMVESHRLIGDSQP